MKTRRQDKQLVEDGRQELQDILNDEDEGVSETDEEIEEEEFEEAGMESSNDDSDSAPEDISFAKSKEQAVESLSRALKAVQEQRKQIKEKRQKHNNLLSEQKKKKLQKLQEKKLSAEFLQQVSETSFQNSTTETKKDGSTNKSDDVNHRRFGDDDEAGEIEGGDQPVPIADRFYVVATEKSEKSPHPTPPNVQKFLQHSLYGKHLNRKPVADVLATKAKVEHRPANNFGVSKGRKKRRGYKRRPLPIA